MTSMIRFRQVYPFVVLEYAMNNVEPASATRLPLSAPRDYDGSLILRCKLRPPQPRRGAVSRRDLLSRLDADIEDTTVKLLLVVAPAGWGKTSLLGDWWSSRKVTPSAWLSVDRGDNDPVRFWTHLITAMKDASGSTGPDAERLLDFPEAKITEILLSQVINDCTRVSGPITVIIDNYHLISNASINECVGFLIENLPPTVRLILVTRSEPALPLARLRARGEMKEIRADELRFSEEEAAGLLNGALNLGLPSDYVRILRQRTEGWAAGLYLAGLSLRGHEELDRQVHSFAGDNRQITDYLVAEVLDAQPAYIRTFLTRTAVLDRMCAGLCDVVTGGSGSQRILEELESSSLFIVPLDASRSWYRYHSLFADMLRLELERSEPGIGPLLHQRASEWHRQRGSAAEAVCHAIMASDLGEHRESATALLALANLHECRGESHEAEEAALKGLDLARRGQARLEAVLALLYLARIKVQLGRAEEAQASLSSARDVMRRCAEPGILVELMAAAERAFAEQRRGQRPDGLTGREVEVFELLAAGKTNNEIAADLVVSVHTVERHLQNAYRKIGARNRGQAAAYIARAARLARSGRFAWECFPPGRTVARRPRWSISLMP